MALHVLVSGRRACFRRPEFKRDFVTYDAITPPACRIIFERLYHPTGLSWSLEAIEILNPIRREWETVAGHDDGDRRVLALHDVAYRLSATLVDAAGCDRSDKHATVFNQKISGAAGHLSVHLGLKEYDAQLALAPPRAGCCWADRPVDLGWMPFDTGKGRGASARFFHAVAIAGTIDLAGLAEDSFAT